MDCPVCADTQLVMSERQGVEIDYCPKCRGVWLDRGELDKIIDKSVGASPAAAAPAAFIPPNQNPNPNPNWSREQQAQAQGYAQPYYKKKKREGFLSELFDFD